MRLAAIFSLDVAAYAVMSNHYHIVLRVDAERAKSWSVEEVLQRWTQLFTGPVLGCVDIGYRSQMSTAASRRNPI
jgi:type IV secretory pathway VirB2 component (pilin)